VPEASQRATDLALAAFGQGQREGRAIARGLVAASTDLGTRRRLAVLEPHAALEGTRRCLAQPSLHGHAIDARALPRWVQQCLGDLAVVGQQQQSFAVPVEPADREDPRLPLGNQVHHGRATLGISSGGEDSPGLVKEPVAGRLRRDRTTVQGDAILAWVRAVAEGGDAAVHRDPSLAHQQLAASPRAEPGCGQDLLESFANGQLRLVPAA